jgi:DeoR/GlpR family transcriptional regulator of sugar metabolism
MFAAERMNIIKKYLREHGKLDVHSASEMFNVSEVTVRRDLEKLEEAGFLIRQHGGAVLKVPDERPAGLEPGESDMEARGEGEEIAHVAAMMVKDGDFLFLMNGPLNLRIARRLAERSGVTVLTNDVAIALEVGRQTANKAVLLGGSVNVADRAVFGSLALANIQNFCVKKLFIEIDGVNDRLQLTVSSQEKAALIQAALACADERIVLAGADRFSRNAFFRLGDIGMANKVITSARIPERFKAMIFESNIPLFTSIDAFEGGA